MISHILKVDTHHFLRPVAMLPMHVWFADCALPKILDPGVPNTLYTEKGLSTDLDPSVDGDDHKILKRGLFFPGLSFARPSFPPAPRHFTFEDHSDTGSKICPPLKQDSGAFYVV